MKTMKKSFKLFVCTLMIVCCLSTLCYKPVKVKAAAITATAVVGVEAVTIILDILVCCLVGIGAYELYENKDAVAEMVGSLVDTWQDKVNGGYDSQRTWGNSGDTHILDPNTGQWVLNPDFIPTAEKPVVLTPEQQEEYGLDTNYWTSVEELTKAIWEKRHGGGSGGDSGDNGDGGDSENPSNGLNNIKTVVGAGLVSSISAYLVDLFSGNIDMSEYVSLDSVINADALPVYTGDYVYNADGTIFYNCVASAVDNGYTYVYKFAESSNERVAGYYSGGLYGFMGTNGSGYGFHKFNINEKMYDLDGNLKADRTNAYSSLGRGADDKCNGTSISCNFPVFLTIQEAESYIKGEIDSSGAINNEKKKFTNEDYKDMASKLPMTLSGLTGIPSGYYITTGALKNYVDTMLEYGSDENYEADTDKQTEDASTNMDDAVKEDIKPKEDDETTEPEPTTKPLPAPTPELPNPEPITIDDIDATRDWSLVFPFCIPFDIIDLIRTLSAEPVAPKWEVPLYLPEYGIEYTFILDLGEFETLAEVFRTCELILFILSLAIITGKVIKW